MTRSWEPRRSKRWLVDEYIVVEGIQCVYSGAGITAIVFRPGRPPATIAALRELGLSVVEPQRWRGPDGFTVGGHRE